MPSVSDYDLDSLLAALIAGDAINITGSEDTFRLGSDASCRALHFYSQNPRYWDSTAREAEVNALLQALKQTLPEVATQAAPAEGKKPSWHLVKIRAHRFGGIHLHCDENGAAPPLFEVALDHPLTVIGGFNGAGKSSLLSIIVWGLTGRALRSQDVPRKLEDSVLAERLGEAGEDTAEGEEDIASRTISLPPPVVPLPSAKNLKVLNDQPADDTWVELVFRDEDGKVEKIIKRKLVRSRQSYRTEVEGLDELGLNKLALEVGTVMPAIAAQMRFNESTELADAVAELTGFAPLVEFGAHCGRLINNQLRDKQVKSAQETMAACVSQFVSQRNQLSDHVGHHPGLAGFAKLTAPAEGDKGAACETSLQAVAEHLDGLEAQANANFKAILGAAPELPDDAAARRLNAQITQADDALKGAELKALPSQKLIGQIGALTDEDLESAQAVIDQFLAKARELAEVLAEEAKAKRYQLYVRVADWHKEHHGDAAFENCPICSTNLDEVPTDAVLDKNVRDALEECRGAAAHLAQSAAKAEEGWNATYLNALPAKARALVDKDLPDWLPRLYQQACTQELFTKPGFDDVLAPLRENAQVIWQDAAVALPDALPFEERRLPDAFPRTTGLTQRLAATARFITLAKYRSENTDAIQTVMARLIGTAEGKDEETAAKNRLPLRRQLALLRVATQNVHPISTAKGMLANMTSQLTAWKAQIKRLEDLEWAAVAVEPFTRFPELVREEVEGLRVLLDGDIRKWVGRIYSAHYVDGPEYGGLDGHDGGLGLRAAIGKLAVPAHNVLNASALRAHVWGFMLALWERVTNRHGGLGLFLLDDPQIVFDRRNAENFAAAVPTMVEAGMRPIITSNDEQFTAILGDYCSGRGRPELKLGFMDLSPLSSAKPKADLVASVERIALIAKKWEDNQNQTHLAQDYVREARTYLECRLWDLLASDPELLHRPTFGDLVGKLKQFRSQGQPPFTERPFETLLNDGTLDLESDFYKVINKAHHEGIRLIGPTDAQHVHEKLKDIRPLVDACWTTYARWVGRLPEAEEGDDFDIQAPLPEAVALENRAFPILGKLAAREHSVPLAEVDQTVETFSTSDLGNVALYGIRAATLGIEALQGQTVIVSLDDEPSSGDLVIALRGDMILARRLSAPRDARGQIILESTRTASPKVAPTYIWPEHTTRALKIIGVLFDNNTPDGQGEAALVMESAAFHDAVHAAEVKDDSAYPVAWDGDRVLLSPIPMESLTDEVLAQFQKRIIAVEISEPGGGSTERFSFLKRLGIPVRGHHRTYVLDNIGFSASGEGETVHFPDDADDDDTFPIVHRLWRAVGILFNR